MIEIFCTNVTCDLQANSILERLQKEFPHYEINFDLEDCDNILRVDGKTDAVNRQAIIELVKLFNCEIKVLPDEITNVKKNDKLAF
jgi:hypothetical protein